MNGPRDDGDEFLRNMGDKMIPDWLIFLGGIWFGIAIGLGIGAWIVATEKRR